MKYKKTFITLFFIALLHLLIFFALPPLAIYYGKKKLKERYKSDLQIEKIYLNPYTFYTEIEGFSLSHKNRTLLSFDKLSLDIDFFSLFKETLVVEEVNLTKPYIYAGLGKEGKLNFLSLLPKTKKREKEEPKPSETKPFFFLIKALGIHDAKLSLFDQRKRFSYGIDQIHFALNDFTMTPHKTAHYTLSMRLNQSATLKNRARVTFPLQTKGDFSLETFTLDPFMPYLKALPIQIKNRSISTKVDYGFDQASETLDLENGYVRFMELGVDPYIDLKQLIISFSTQLQKKHLSFKTETEIDDKVHLKIKGESDLATQNITSDFELDGFELSYLTQAMKAFLPIFATAGKLSLQGKVKKESELQLSLNNFLLENLLIKDKNEENLTSAKEIRMSTLDFGNNALKIGSLELISPSIKIEKYKNKTLNLTSISTQKPSKKENNTTKTAPQKKASLELEVSPILVKGAHILFNDFSLPSPFSMTIAPLNITVDRISLDKNSTHIALDAIINRYGMLKLNGSLIPTAPMEDLNMKLKIDNLSLKPLSPFSEEAILHRFTKGKLFVDIDARIDQGELNTQNIITIQNASTQTIESDDENKSSPPLGFALAILEDIDGKATLNVPIDGNLTDMNIHLTDLIIDTLSSVVIKIAASPFTLIGNLLGVKGDTLKDIRFESGEWALLAPEKEKLDKLFSALQKRPNILLSITPLYTQEDENVLKTRLYETKLKEAMPKKLTKKEKKAFKENFYKENFSLIKVEKTVLEKLALKRADTLRLYLTQKEKHLVSRIIIKKEVIVSDEKKSLLPLEIKVK